MKYFLLITAIFFIVREYNYRHSWAHAIGGMQNNLKETDQLVKDMSALLKETRQAIRDIDAGKYKEQGK